MENEEIDPTDKDVLKRAMKSFRKRLKTFRSADENSAGHGPFSGGKVSGIVAIRPPKHLPQAVWDELVKQEKLTESEGLYQIKE